MSFNFMASVTAVILEPKKIKSVTASTLSPSVCHEMRGWDARIECCYSCSFLNKWIYFLLKGNCFTEFCYFLSNLNMNQP